MPLRERLAELAVGLDGVGVGDVGIPHVFDPEEGGIVLGAEPRGGRPCAEILHIGKADRIERGALLRKELVDALP